MIFYHFNNNEIQYMKNKIFNIFIISSILLFLNLDLIFPNIFFDSKYNIIKEWKGFFINEFFKTFFVNPISTMKKYREINSKNILLDSLRFSKNEYPDITVIITVYNQANCFHSALRSVQNQSFKNIEIIIIDDCSSDDSVQIIEKYMEEDRRIIFLKHESNEGPIKSRTDGIKISKGKYITIIDGDDSLSNQNILFNCFNIAKLADLDIVDFNYAFFERKNYKKLFNYKNIKNLSNRVIYQPELSFKFVVFSKKDSVEGFANRNIWAKFIRNEIFKKVLKYIGPKYTDDFIREYEDTIMSVSLFKVANSYFYLKECGYYYAKDECKNSSQILNLKKCFPKKLGINRELDPIKYLNFLLDNFQGKEIEKFLLYKELIYIDHFKHLDNLINSNFSYVYLILNKINKSNYFYNERTGKISEIIYKLKKKENIIKLNRLYKLY